MKMPTADEIKTALGVKPHLIEGGFFRETYRSATVIPAGSLPPAYPRDSHRSFGTAIYYADYISGERSVLIEHYPAIADAIRRLTRKS